MTRTSEARRNRRQSLNLTLKLSTKSDELPCEVVNINQHGACIKIPRNPLDIEEIRLNNLFDLPLSNFSASAKIIWKKESKGGIYIGLSFVQTENKIKSFLSALGYKERNFDPLKYILMIGVPLIPILSIWFSFNSNKQNKAIFSIAITFLIFERLWETFFTSKERGSIKSSEDWTISAVSFYYITLYLICIFDFFNRVETFPAGVIFIGVLLLLSSFSLRWSALLTLGSEWGIHVIGKDKTTFNNKTLIQKGPYKVIRHPIYLSVIIELIAIPIIFSSPLALIFSFLVNIPLQIKRLKLEEMNLIFLLGDEYIRYQNTVPAFFPRLNKK